MIARSHRLALVSAMLLTPAARAQFQNGDILVNYYGEGSSPPSLVQYRPDGTVVAQTSGGSGIRWIGVTPLAGDRWLTARRYPNGVNIFDATGVEIATFDTPEITYATGDTGVLSDGTLVVNDLDGEIELYSETGTHLGTISNSQLDRPVGMYIDDQDHIWVADVIMGLPGQGAILEFEPNGTLLTLLTTNFVAGDLILAADGTIWCADYDVGFVKHLDTSGNVLGSFPTAVLGFFIAIGMARDGTLYCMGTNSDQLYHYDQTGTLLGTFPAPGHYPASITVVGGIAPGDGYCFGDSGSGTACPCANDNDGSIPGSGCANGVFPSGAQLIGSGFASVSADTLVLTTTHLEPNNSGLYFQAENDLSPGVLWGDGLRCAGGNLKRLQVRFADALGSSATTIGISTKAGNVSPGDRKYYQCWYRTVVNPPCGAGVSDFNSSNGYAVTWLP